MRWSTDAEGISVGECRLRCWPSPLKDSATCASYKALGTSWENALKRKHVPGMPKRLREDGDRATPIEEPLPQEIDIDMDQEEFRRVLRQVLREELGVGHSEIGERWRGGELVLAPGKKDTQEKRIPLEQFFHKIVMIRDKLRVLEQKINGSKQLPEEDKIQLQQYITGCYGSLTTFNVLFRDREDGFQGSGTKD